MPTLFRQPVNFDRSLFVSEASVISVVIPAVHKTTGYIQNKITLRIYKKTG